MWRASLLVVLSICFSPVSSQCNRTFLGSSGEFSSENFPDKYEPGVSCNYRVATNTRSSFKRLSCRIRLEDSTGCTKDYLQVGRAFYCGRKDIDVIMSGPFQVKFHSDDDIQRPGFQCRFKEETGAAVGSLSGGHPCSPVVVERKAPKGWWYGKIYIPVKRTVSGWSVTLRFDKDVLQYKTFSASITRFSSTALMLRNKKYNKDIQAGDKLYFGLRYRPDPSQRGLSTITSIRFNNEEQCKKQTKETSKKTSPSFDFTTKASKE